MPNLDKELERLSNESGHSVEDIKKDLEELMADGLDDEGAIVVWQSEHALELGGRTLKQALFRVMAARPVRKVETKSGESEVSDFTAFVKDEGDSVRLCSFTVWGDNAHVVDNLQVDGLYIGDVKVRDGDGDVSKASLIKGEASPVDDGGQLPKCSEMLKQMKLDSVANAANYLKSNALLTGIVGEVFQTDFSMGLSVSAVGSNPVAVYLASQEVPDVKKGQRIILYGYVKESKRGGIQVSDAIYFKA